MSNKNCNFVLKQRAAWIKRITCAATRVSQSLCNHTEAVLQKALVSELQTYPNIHLLTEVVKPIYYTNSKQQKSIVGTVRLDVVLTTPTLTFVLELKLSAHSKRLTADQLAKYRAVLPTTAILVLVVFSAKPELPAIVHVLA